jgi:hypothetical protein
MKLMNNPNNELVLFDDRITPSLKLIRKTALTEQHFEGFRYDSNRNENTEVWIKE